jgi:hypothetical protein
MNLFCFLGKSHIIIPPFKHILPFRAPFFTEKKLRKQQKALG